MSETKHKVIYKYPIRLQGQQSVSLPRDAEVLCAQLQGEQPMLWAMRDAPYDAGDLESRGQSRIIEIIGTGAVFADVPQGMSRHYIGTVQDGGFVWHVFQQLPEGSL